MPAKPDQPSSPDDRGKPRRRAVPDLEELRAHHEQRPMMASLYRRAQAELRKRQKERPPTDNKPDEIVDPQRMLHELEVHQVELEMQNSELTESRNRMELLLEKYTDLYDFAPVGYFTLDEKGQILEANLMGASLLNMERSQLLHQRLSRFVVPESQPEILAFLDHVFSGTGKQACEAALVRPNATCWASFHGSPSISMNHPRKCCRVVVSDITTLKHAREAQSRLEAVTTLNQELQKEIVRRQVVEEALQKSEQAQRRLLAESRRMEAQLRRLSHQILRAQEEECKRISRELHDVIAQTLTSINVHLATLKSDALLDREGLEKNLTSTRRLVEHAVHVVHQFACELRPALLDDLGLIPALHSYLKTFSDQNGVQAHLTAFADVEKLSSDQRTVLYRVAQEALTNIGKHAKASRANVTIIKLPDAVGLTIDDDGRGFKPESVLNGRRTKRLGLLGMRERVEMVNGSFTLESTPGKGTTVSLRIPFAKPRARGRGGKIANEAK